MYFTFQDFSDTTALPIIRVDPDGRCAAMLIYGTKLVILPFQKDVYSDEVETMMTEGEKGPKTRSVSNHTYFISRNGVFK